MQELKAKPRTELGKKTNALRRAGFLPAVIYGEGIESRSISVPYKDFEKVYREAGESTLLTLDVEGKKYNVLIHDLFRDPLKGQPLHADFYAVRMDKVIRTKVPVEFIGESPAVKNEGGILIKIIQELEVEALPQDLPHSINLDISSLSTLESKLFIKDILVPKAVKVMADPGDTIVLVEPPRSVEELAAIKEAPSVTEAPPEVKTERELKEELKEKEKAETEIEAGANGSQTSSRPNPRL